MMNFMEFSSDRFVSLNLQHYSYGLIMDRIPLIKHLKLREVFGLKMYYGHLSDENNPNINPDLIQFVKNEEGQALTYAMGNQPYIEASIGFSNIFKVFKVDLVKRFTYLSNPGLPTLFDKKGMGIRFNFYVEF